MLRLPLNTPITEAPREPLEPGAVDQAAQVPAAQERSPAKPDDRFGEGPGLCSSGEVPQSSSGRIDSMLAVLRANEVIAGGRLPRVEVQKQLFALAGAGYSDAAQQKFIDYLQRALKLAPGERIAREDAADLAWIAGKLRDAVPSRETSLDRLAAFFREQGLRLRWFDAAPPADISLQLDRGGFREQLRAFEQRLASGGTVSRRDALALASMLSQVADPADLEWAQWQFERRLGYGTLSGMEPAAKDILQRFFAERTQGRPNRHAIAGEAFRLRRELERAGGCVEAAREALASWREQVQRAGADADPDAIFLADRVIERELNKACAKGTDVGALKGTLQREIAPRLEGKLDRYRLNRKVERLVSEGAISAEVGLMMRAAVVTSNTPTELGQALRSMAFQLQLMMMQHIQQAWDELMDTFSRNMSDDLRDANGNVIERAVDRFLRLLAKELELERLAVRPERELVQRRRSELAGRAGNVQRSLATAATPGERASLRNEQAQIASEAADLDEPVR